MQAERISLKSEQSGFTFIELVVSTAIIFILSAMALSAFGVYRENVNYKKAVYDLRNARAAYNIVQGEIESITTLPMTFSSTSGGVLTGQLSTLFPGATTSNEVRLGVLFNNCDSVPSSATNILVLSQPCNAGSYSSYMLRCDGIEVLSENISQSVGLC